MRKAYFIFLVGCLLLLGVCAMLILGPKSIARNGNLIVNGTTSLCPKIRIYKTFAEIPLVETLIALGCNVTWSSDATAYIDVNGKTYVLNIADVSFTEEGSTYNLLNPAPGSTTFTFQQSDKELCLDTNTVRSLLYFLEYDISITIDYRNSLVIVQSQ